MYQHLCTPWYEMHLCGIVTYPSAQPKKKLQVQPSQLAEAAAATCSALTALAAAAAPAATAGATVTALARCLPGSAGGWQP